MRFTAKTLEGSIAGFFADLGRQELWPLFAHAKKRHAKAWKEEKKMKYTVAIGRFFYSLLFIMRGMTHFSKTSDWVRSKPGSSLCFHRSSVFGFNGRGRRFEHPFRISREGRRLGVGSVPGSGHCDDALILKGHRSNYAADADVDVLEEHCINGRSSCLQLFRCWSGQCRCTQGKSTSSLDESCSKHARLHA
jgi:hypothetical protein